MDFSYYINLGGIAVFAVSGALAAAEKRSYHNDVFSAFFTGFITAIGGGTLRDITLGNYPVSWIRDENVLWAIFSGILLSIIFSKYLNRVRKGISLFDTIGVGIYTVIGTRIALSYDVNPFASAILGMVTAVFGGVIRDMMINEVPLIFRREIYATACLAGAGLYILLDKLDVNPEWNTVISATIVIGIRLVSVRMNWALPKIRLPK
ncbi:trimeric intracellular cation channel family protein [Leptospira wolffii]|uniref:Trimeric intracellular cation channel family protein n=1 Tax=Leptospira wolffii TaxID=409998 RepID=A0ABV5BNX3_9LEPT|nr:trimeric intracellular cation channel family protein [Leptospira wolffii]EPG65967.1 putative membrane protein [Leptospira wolffii serovar Khorat str. Khorat-H2]TGL47567.1 trimeric intracellular cation channel family protein [Leptospira wolffii]